MSLACLLVCAALLAGCKGPCRNLAESLCQCALSSADKDACNQNVANEDSRIGPTASDNAFCLSLLHPADGGLGCDCHLINTTQGKMACGLSRSSGDSGVVQ
jgi:putative hemolysin